MSMTQALIAEFEQESKTTRRFLEQLPKDKLAWKPHEKSMTAGQLALHIATSPAQVSEMGAQDECPPPDFGAGFPEPASVDEILQSHDESVRKATAVLTNLGDAGLAGTWNLAVGGQTLMSMPRAAFFRSIMLNHVYHHRGQFGVYLRLLGAMVPSCYGPSADEMPPEFEKIMEAMQATSAKA